MLEKIDHIGIAVIRLEDHLALYRDVLMLEFLGIEEVAEQKVRTAIFRIGEVKIELLEATQPDSPIARFIEKRGEGLHHIAYQTNHIGQEIKNFKEKGLAMLDESPRIGAHQMQIAFIHPQSSGKVLTEICQNPQQSQPQERL